MSKIEFNNYDLHIKKLPDGTEMVQISGRLAFNKKFIEQMKELGVEEMSIKLDDNEEYE